MRLLVTLATLLLMAWAPPIQNAFAQTASPKASPTQQGLPIKYVDVTKVENGWGTAQLAAAQASRNKGFVIISYLDSPPTRALYDVCVPHTRAPSNLPIVGFIRSPLAPPTIAQTPSPLGFDIFYDDVVIPPMENPDPRFTRTDQLDAFMRGIKRNFFAKPAGD